MLRITTIDDCVNVQVISEQTPHKAKNFLFKKYFALH